MRMHLFLFIVIVFQFTESIGVGIDILRTVIYRADRISSEQQKTIICFALKCALIDHLKGKRELVLYLLDEVLRMPYVESALDVSEQDGILHCCLVLLDSVGKLQSGVKKALFMVMGSVARHFPELLGKQGKMYALQFAITLSEELKSQVYCGYRVPAYNVIEGCFVGLNGCMEHFASGPLFDGQCRMKMDSIHSTIKMVINPHSRLNRLGPVKAVLNILVTHPNLFRGKLFRDYEVCAELLKMVEHDRRNAESIYKYFSDIFDGTMSNCRDLRRASMVAESYGRLFAVSHILYGSWEVNRILRQVLFQFHQFLSRDDEPVEQKVNHITSPLEAFARALPFLSNVPFDIWQTLEDIHVKMFVHLPVLGTKSSGRCKKVTYAIFAATVVIDRSYISSVVYQALVHLLTLPPLDRYTETPFDVTYSERQFTVANHGSLWRKILAYDVVDLSDFGCDSSMQKLAEKEFFDAIMKCVIEILQTLRLGAETTDEDEV
ncbi:hypothetical protein D918_09755 [Trichuris suis]|nr:hypothetical protein D918_09755 [Trichuris suis]